jgi:hypothetical protein
MSRIHPIKCPRSIFALAALSILLCGGWFGWRVTCYNAGPQIQHVFPGARPYFDPCYSPDPTISAGIRGANPSYFGMDESLGFTLIDSPDPLDLQARFSRLSHLYLYSIHSPAARSPTCAPIPVVSPAISFLMTAISPSCLKSNGNAFGPMAIPILNGQRSLHRGSMNKLPNKSWMPTYHSPLNHPATSPDSAVASHLTFD